MNHHFELPGSYKKWTMGLLIVGVITLLYGFIAFHPFEHAGHGVNVNGTRFWASLLQNSTYWLLTVNAAMFFICVTTLAMGGWQVALRRVPEAIASMVPILGIICFVILM
ncbi:MAG: quinol:cytochrome C oxidoreductase, partial [Ferruginibacter sp.]